VRLEIFPTRAWFSILFRFDVTDRLIDRFPRSFVFCFYHANQPLDVDIGAVIIHTTVSKFCEPVLLFYFSLSLSVSVSVTKPPQANIRLEHSLKLKKHYCHCFQSIR
jgi:hypothetical protein